MHTTNNAVNNNPFIPDVPFHLDLLLRPKQPIKQNLTPEQNSQNEQNISPNINFDFKENSPFQEGIMSETSQRPVLGHIHWHTINSSEIMISQCVEAKVNN